VLIKASRELRHGAVVDLQKTQFNKFEIKLKWFAIILSLIATVLYVIEGMINNINCYGNKFYIITTYIDFIMLVTTPLVCVWFILVARAQTSDSWRRTRHYVRLCDIIISRTFGLQ